MASPISTKSFFSIDTNNTTRAYAKTADDASYKHYGPISWSMWGSWYPATNKNIFCMWDTTAGNNRSWLFSVQIDQTFRTIYSWDGTSFSLKKTASAIFDGSFKHIVCTFNNGVEQVYVNNVLQSQNTTIAWGGGAAGLHNADQLLLVASEEASAPVADKGAPGCYLNYSIWNKVLSTAEITAIFNNGAPGDISQISSYAANCTNWWRMDQTDTAPTLVDVKAGSGANMTITKSGATPFFNVSLADPSGDDIPDPTAQQHIL